MDRAAIRADTYHLAYLFAYIAAPTKRQVVAFY